MIVLPVSWALMRHPRAWRAWILLASYVFYAWWDWRFIFLLAAATVVNHVLAVAIHRSRTVGARKSFLALVVAFDIGLLGYFKYANFFLSSADNLVGTSWIAHVVLPVGISFYTFMAISYAVFCLKKKKQIDVHRAEFAFDLVPNARMKTAWARFRRSSAGRLPWLFDGLAFAVA